MITPPASRARRTRLIVGVVVSLLALGGLAATALTPWPQVHTSAVSLSAARAASTSLAACSGAVLASGQSTADAAEVTDAAAPSVVASADGEPPTEATLAAPDVFGGVGPNVYSAAPSGTDPVDVAAAQSVRVQQTGLSGLAAEACTRPAMESWLVGGSGMTGAADLLLLANPGTVAARVSLTVYGAQGATTPPAGTELLIAAGTQRVIPVASLALGEESPVIRVTAAEAPVRASLQTSITRVLVPGGVDQVVAAAAPATTTVIPGVRITQDSGTTGDSEVPSFLRLLAPASDGTATVVVLGPDGVVRDEQSVDMLAGVPLQLDLDGLAAGTYSVTVSATTPITGAVWSATGFAEGDDFAWFAAAEPLSGSALVAVAPAPSPALTVTAPDADTTVELEGAGSSRTIPVPAGHSVTVPVTGGQTYRLSPHGGAVQAAVSFEDYQALAGYTVAAGEAEAAAVTVYPR